MTAYITEADMQRWKKEKRQDILSRVQDDHILWSGDRLTSSSGKKMNSCIYLSRDGGGFICEIYKTRPLTCRNFAPGSSELCPLYYDKK
jgi:Fe-S-cluster containining protein